MQYWIKLFKDSFNALHHKLGFVLSSVTTLSLTYSFMLTALSILFVIVVKPLPYPDSERIVKLDYLRFDHTGVLQSHTYPQPAAVKIYDAQKNNKYLERLSLVRYGNDVIGSIPEQPQINSLYVTPEWFDLFGTSMEVGVPFDNKRRVGSNIPGAVISYQLWQQEFNGSPDVTSQSISINGISHPILGVVKKTFEEPQLFEIGRQTQVWLPWDFNNSDLVEYWELTDNNVMVLGLNKPNQALQVGAQQFSEKAHEDFIEGSQAFGEYSKWRVKLQATSLSEELLGDHYKTVLILIISAVGILLIAATNTTNLFLARTLELQKQLAIRASVGAKKSQIGHVILGESIIIVALSCLAAFVIAKGNFILIDQYFAGYLPRSAEIQLNVYVIVVGILLSIMFSLSLARVCGSLINYDALNISLSNSGKGTSIQVSQKARSFLTGSQVCISMILIFFALVLSSDALKLINKKLDLDTGKITNITFTSATTEEFDLDSFIPKALALKENLINLPYVDSVSFANTPIEDINQFPVKDAQTDTEHFVYHHNIDDKYFDVTSHRLLAGRKFEKDDVKPTSDVLIVNQTFASKLANNPVDVVGKIITFTDVPLRIVGVVQDLDIPGVKDIVPRIYIPNNGYGGSLLIRTNDGVNLTRSQIISALKQTDSQFVLTKFAPLEESLDTLRLPYYIVMVSSIVLSLLTVFLSCVGLFGLMAYSVGLREVEISVRLSVGAKHNMIKHMMLLSCFSSFNKGALISTMIILVSLFTPAINAGNYITIDLLSIFLLSFFVVLLILVSATFHPTMKLLQKPISVGLRGGG
jgi:predicted permease